MSKKLMDLQEFYQKVYKTGEDQYDPLVPRLGVVQPIQHLDKIPIPYFVLRELSDCEMKRFTEANNEFANLKRVKNLLRIVELNTDEYNDTVNMAIEKFRSYISPTRNQIFELTVSIDQRILNYLSSMRTYLDHIQTYFVRRYGEQSVEHLGFKGATSQEFDSRFSYRFFSKLRNYAQHCGMPLGEFKAKKSSDGHSQEMLSTTEFYFARDELLKDDSKWGHAKTDLEMMPEIFPITPLLNEVTESIRRIDEKVTSIIETELSNHREFLMELINETDYEQLGGELCVYHDITFKRNDGGKIDCNPGHRRFPMELLT